MFYQNIINAIRYKLFSLEDDGTSKEVNQIGSRVTLQTVGVVWLLALIQISVTGQIGFEEIVPLSIGLILFTSALILMLAGRTVSSERTAVATVWVILLLELFFTGNVSPIIFSGFFVVTFLGAIFIHSIKLVVPIIFAIASGLGYYFYSHHAFPLGASAQSLTPVNIGLYLCFVLFTVVIGRAIGLKLNRSLDRSDQLNQLFQAFFHQSSDAIFILDLNLQVLQLNPQAEELVNHPAEEVLGRRIFEFIPEEAVSQSNELVSDILANGKISNIQLDFLTEDGVSQFYQVSGNMIFQEEGKPDHIQVTIRDITERKMIEDRIRRLAMQDHLTKVDNRLSLTYRLNSLISKMSRDGGRFALIYFDLDNFKGVNDRYGHYIGDQLLVAFTKRLHGTIRKTDFLARMGGDEFVLILENYLSEDDLEFTLERLRGTLVEPFKIGEHLIYLEASMGVSCYPEDGADAEKLLRVADSAMYSAKHA